MGRLEGKVALITGGARGQGEAEARLFVSEGAKVLIADVLDAEGAKVAAEIGEAALYVHLDVAQEDDWRRAVETAVATFGKLDVLVNNAGIVRVGPMENMDLESYMAVINVNQVGTFLGMRAVVAPMREAGGGSIVNVASSDGVKGMNGVAAYASTKWALRGITKATAMELARHRIRVNSVCPEAGSAELSAPFLPAGIDPVRASEDNLKQLLAPPAHYRLDDFIGDVARTVLFLASDDCPTATAADFIIDGGLTAGYVQPGIPGCD